MLFKNPYNVDILYIISGPRVFKRGYIANNRVIQKIYFTILKRPCQLGLRQIDIYTIDHFPIVLLAKHPLNYFINLIFIFN